MAELVKLRTGESFSRDRGYVLVEATSSGLFAANGSVLRPGKGMVYYSPAPSERERSVQSALAWAADNAVPVVYVRSNDGEAAEEVLQVATLPLGGPGKSAPSSDSATEHVSAPPAAKRALELARSGEFQCFAHIRARLRAEGYEARDIDAKALHTELRGYLRDARRQILGSPNDKLNASNAK